MTFQEVLDLNPKGAYIYNIMFEDNQSFYIGMTLGDVRARFKTHLAKWHGDKKYPDRPNCQEIFVEVQSQKKNYFRWFDSGDIQSVFMALNIIEVCKQTPNIKHWIPTKELKMWKQALKIESLPKNIVLRASAPMIDQKPVKGFNNTSTVHKNKKAFGLECIAYKQEGKCLECKACYNPKVKNVSYPLH